MQIEFLNYFENCFYRFPPLLKGKSQTKEMAEEAENELLDYEEASDNEAPNESSNAIEQAKKEVKGTYVSIHSSGFRDFLLKPELLRAIVDCGFEHPSEGWRTFLSLHFLCVDKTAF